MMDDNELVFHREIGTRIREARQKCGMSQTDLAIAAGLGTQHISDIEHGKKRMKLITFLRIADALNMPAMDLLFPDGIDS